MRQRLLLLALPLLLAPAAEARTAAGAALPTQTKAQAEIHLLRIVGRIWPQMRMHGLVDAKTHVLANNTQAVCRGRGPRSRGGRYARFLCVIRPLHHGRRQGLYVMYRALAGGGCACQLQVSRRR